MWRSVSKPALRSLRWASSRSRAGVSPLSQYHTESHAALALAAASSSSQTNNHRLFALLGLALFALSDESALCEAPQQQPTQRHTAHGVSFETEQTVTNWSSTHVCHPKRVYEPQSPQELLRLLQGLHARAERERDSERGFRGRARERARPVGTALSPNGLALSDDALVSVHALDAIHVDAQRMLVTVGAGARVSDVLRELRKHGLTLKNFSSIQEQQLGGWTQVSAHGTGVSLPTVEEMIVRMQLATPGQGMLSLSESQSPALFSLAKVGLGALGVVTQLTLQCVPAHRLREHTFSLSMQDIAKEHRERLRTYRHVRYMWFPYVRDTVVVVVSNPIDPVGDDKAKETMTEGEKDPAAEIVARALQTQQADNAATATAPLSDLLIQTLAVSDEKEKAALRALSFSQLRDRLLDVAPLSLAHVQAVNAAEARFWRNSTGTREEDSTQILGFDCGGEQLVFEVCFPIGSLSDNNSNTKPRDILFVEKLMGLIEKHKIPAHCPIEQRWTARSTAKMSPAYSEKEDEVFSWVGVILYLPPQQTSEQRREIEKEFQRYTMLMQPLLDEFNAHAHWAKIELPRDFVEKSDTAVTSSSSSSWLSWLGLSSAEPVLDNTAHKKRMRERLRERFPVEDFNAFRKALDPHSVLSNKIVDSLFDDEEK